jgi:hypothetical protein
MTRINNLEFDLVVSGNVFFDTLLEGSGFLINRNVNGFEKMVSVGGIFNFLPAVSPEIKCMLSCSAFSSDEIKCKFSKNIQLECKRIKSPSCEALIIVDKRNSTRTSFSIPGGSRFHNYTNRVKHHWHHISYLDNLPKYDINQLLFIKSKCNYLSADLCINNHDAESAKLIIEKIKLLDFLIISDSELRAIFNSNLLYSLYKLSKIVKKFVIHSGKFIYIYVDNKFTILKNKYVKGLNTLGAGDFICSKIVCHLINGKHLIEAVIIARNETFDYLIYGKN